MQVKVVIGAPGAGKSTFLARIAKSLPPDKTLILSYSRSAAAAIATKAGPDYTASTIHALCYRDIGLEKSQVFNINIFCKEIGIRPPTDVDTFDPIVHPYEIYSYARTAGINTTDAFWRYDVPYNFNDYLLFVKNLERYKDTYGIYEFFDMLDNYQPTSAPDNLLLDEAQDLSMSLIKPLERLIINGTKKLWLVGDPKQSIYTYSGANSKLMHHFGGNESFLKQSYRCPVAVVNLAKQIFPDAQFMPTSEKGVVTTASCPPSNTDVVLVRTNHQRRQIIKKFMLDENKVMTFHKSKGLQFNNVCLLNSMTKRVMSGNMADEDKVLYTAITRTKKMITIMDGKNGYKIL